MHVNAYFVFFLFTRDVLHKVVQQSINLMRDELFSSEGIQCILAPVVPVSSFSVTAAPLLIRD